MTKPAQMPLFKKYNCGFNIVVCLKAIIVYSDAMIVAIWNMRLKLFNDNGSGNNRHKKRNYNSVKKEIIKVTN